MSKGLEVRESEVFLGNEVGILFVWCVGLEGGVERDEIY